MPDQSVKSPDASWLSNAQWEKLTVEEQEQFAPVCPAFIVELKSKSDSINDLQEKMESWLQNGAKLGWLIVPEEETVYVYEAGKAMNQHHGFHTQLSAEPVLPGFSFDLSKLLIK